MTAPVPAVPDPTVEALSEAIWDAMDDKHDSAYHVHAAECCWSFKGSMDAIRDTLTARAAAPDALRVRIEALAVALQATSDLDYDPSQEGWVCGQHGVGECEQGDCAALPWPEPNTFPTSDFALWADEQFRGVVAPYDRGDVPEMPEESFRAYSLADWPLADALRALLEDGAQ